MALQYFAKLIGGIEQLSVTDGTVAGAAVASSPQPAPMTSSLSAARRS